MMDFKSVQEKWQKAWSDAKLFEVEPNDRKGMMVFAAFPYVNSPPHMGHLRTFCTPDVYARYLRMRGMNVLFPLGFHATGTPVIGYAKRIANNDPDLIESLHTFHVSDEDIKKMTDPHYIAEYFIRQQELELRKVGNGIDWRRKFISIEPLYSKMVEWQFMKLKEKGYLVKGTHPVGWCPNENNAVGQHDTMHDVWPDIEEITAIKFKDRDSDAYFICATYRPETIYGVTNLFVNDGIEYVVAEMGGAQYYVSKDAAFRLSYLADAKVTGKITAAELLKKTAINPLTKEELPILPGYFVKADKGTGVVMSVPSHAPFDYVALERLKASGYNIPKMEYKKLIELKFPDAKKGMGSMLKPDEFSGQTGEIVHREVPALAYLEFLKMNPNSDDKSVEVATKLIYREEARYGVMLVGAYQGKSEAEARDGLKADMVKSGDAMLMYELANTEPVICRCGTKAIVAIVKDQWFINYGDKQWKKQVYSMLSKMKLYPEKYRHTFEMLIDWIDLRAMERAQGLGTRFPFNPEHIIESLSDSTIYMLFYTFDHILRANNVQPEQLKPCFFDYVVDSKGDVASVSKETGIEERVITKCRESLDYWYQSTSSHSAPDLIPNHYVMYMFNHVAVLPERFWPKQLVINGFVSMEGEKMSKSLGNILPAGDAVDKYGADQIRFIEVAGAELDSDGEFSTNALSGVNSRIDYLLSQVIDANRAEGGNELRSVDFWMYSRLNSKIKRATAAMDGLMFKGAYDEVFYSSVAELKRYREIGGKNGLVVTDYLSAVVRMLSPVMPHLSEEFWHLLGNSTLVATEQWPVADEGMVNPGLEECFDIVDSTAEDMNRTLELTGKMEVNKGRKVKSIKVILAEQWKADAFNMLVEGKEIGDIIASMQGKADKERVAKYLQGFRNRKEATQRVLASQQSLFNVFSESRDYLKRRFGCELEIENEQDSQSARSGRAQPSRPSIEVAWS